MMTHDNIRNVNDKTSRFKKYSKIAMLETIAKRSPLTDSQKR